MTLFDRYVVVDWSASASPTTGKDSIWFADLTADGPSADDVSLLNPATRAAAVAALVAVLDGSADERVLIGVDAALGYPAGTADLFGLAGTPWRATWQAIADRSTDDEQNRNNRFEVAAGFNAHAGSGEGPFWGCPTDAFGASLRRTKPAAFATGEFRLAERCLRTGGLHPKSCWQLLGAGSVGSQTLTLLPILYDLLDRVDVWPFTTGLDAPTGQTAVVAEIWPTMFVREIPIGMVPDAAQVAGTAKALSAADRTGELVEWLAPALTPCDRAMIEREEGWILGACADMPPIAASTV